MRQTLLALQNGRELTHEFVVFRSFSVTCSGLRRLESEPIKARPTLQGTLGQSGGSKSTRHPEPGPLLLGVARRRPRLRHGDLGVHRPAATRENGFWR